MPQIFLPEKGDNIVESALEVSRMLMMCSGIRLAAPVLGASALLVALSASPAGAQQQAPTFTKDIAPIFQKNCMQCHQPGSIGPMSLTTYQEARPWARAIKTKVVAGEMPPYRYDREIGIQDLKEDLRLSLDEIETISRWVDSGAPQGNPADMPPPIKFRNPDEWAFADEFGAARSHHQDEAVHAARPAARTCGGGRSCRRASPKDRCIKAVSVKPSAKGRAAAHHANSELMTRDEKTGEYMETERLSEYALGKAGEIVPPDSCRVLPANSMVRWDVHYYPTGEELVENDVIEMGVWLYPKGHQGKHKQDLKLYSLLMKGGDLEIAPNGKIMTQGFHSFKTPVRIDSFQPHGHFRLVGKTLEIFYPETGKLEMISSVSNWTNSWHTSHIYADDAAPLVPEGRSARDHRLLRQHRGQPLEPGSRAVGRPGQPHGRRDVARLDRRDASRRRELRAAGGRARSQEEEDADAEQQQQ